MSRVGVSCGEGWVGLVNFNFEKIESLVTSVLELASKVVFVPQEICLPGFALNVSVNSSGCIFALSSPFSILIVFNAVAFCSAFSSLIEVGADFNQFYASTLFADL